jgi:uncharacterized protein YceK
MKSVAALALLSLAGCGTIADASGGMDAPFDGPPPHVFGGVRVDVFMASQTSRTLGWLHYLDIPFSLPLDVVLLPVSIPLSLFYSPDPKNDVEVPK